MPAVLAAGLRMILAQADIMEVSRQLELAVFPDATLDLVALYADA
jgi:hypothetical protein